MQAPSTRGRPAGVTYNSKAELVVHVTDHHPNEIAHALAAERIAEHLVELLGGD